MGEKVAPGKTIAVRQLLNRGIFVCSRQGHTVRSRSHRHHCSAARNLFTSPPLDEFKVSDNLTIEVQLGV